MPVLVINTMAKSMVGVGISVKKTTPHSAANTIQEAVWASYVLWGLADQVEIRLYFACVP